MLNQYSLLKKISRLSLLRRKSVHSTSKKAWLDIIQKLKIKPSQVTANHTSKAWMWKPKKNCPFVFMNPPKNKSKTSSKKSSKKKVTVKTSRKDFDMCKKIDDALKNKNVKQIIIKK